MSKIISLCGVERGDFAYYIAALLSKAGNVVLLIDNSYSNEIFHAISKWDEDNELILEQNISYMKNVFYEAGSEEDGVYDCVVIWHGMNINQDLLYQSDFVYLLPDYTPKCLQAIKEAITDASVVSAIGMRDAVENTKISDTTACKMMDMNKDLLRFAIVYDGKDYENYLAFLYNGRQTFANLTPNYTACLKAFVADILEIDPKQVGKLYRNTKKAKTFV